jgi:hypothetical protein
MAISYRELTRRADCLQDNSSARTPRKPLASFVKDACLQLHCLAVDVLFFCAFAWRGPYRKQFPLYCSEVLKRVFTGRRIETAVLLLLPVFFAVRIFTDIPLLL